MKKLVRFLGTPSGSLFPENLVSAVYKPNKDVKMLFLKEGEPTIVDEEVLVSVQKMIDVGNLQEIEGYTGGKILLSGYAKVISNASTPVQIDAVISHSLGNSNYYVVIDNENYEIVNKGTSSFTITLKEDAEDSINSVYYVVLSSN